MRVRTGRFMNRAHTTFLSVPESVNRARLNQWPPPSKFLQTIFTPPASARPHKHIHTLRHEEGGAFGSEEGLEFLPHLPVAQLSGFAVCGVLSH